MPHTWHMLRRIQMVVVGCLFVVAANAARRLPATPDTKDWQEGTVQSVVIKYGTSIEVVNQKNVRYQMMVIYDIHKVDLIPVTGIVTVIRRQSRMVPFDVTVGNTVRFAVSSSRGWVIDDHGIERRMLVKSVSLVHPVTP
jgi:hypothetical protein